MSALVGAEVVANRPRPTGSPFHPERQLPCCLLALHNAHFNDNRYKFERRRLCAPKAGSANLIGGIGSTLRTFQGGAEGIGAFLDKAGPQYYLVYLLAAGFGLPCSEDALVVWVGAKMSKGFYGNFSGIACALGIVYIGVVMSDMITFGIGVMLRLGFWKGLKKSLIKDDEGMHKALGMLQKWSRWIGLIQRFSLGFRGPLCLVCGFTGVSALKFLGGVALGALGTMPLQLLVGHLLRDSNNVYLTALALASGPNLIGHVLGPVLSAVGFWWASKRPPSERNSPRINT